VAACNIHVPAQDFSSFFEYVCTMDVRYEPKYWGQKDFNLLFICGIGAGLCNLLIAPFSPVGPQWASGAFRYGSLRIFISNRNIYIYGLIPVKAKYLVIIYMLLELFSVAAANDGIAFAHLGGVIGLIYL
jgi:membrane associated rhomboid family serine protease